MKDEATPFRVTHHTDAGHRYSTVHGRYADGTTTLWHAQGHVFPELVDTTGGTHMDEHDSV